MTDGCKLGHISEKRVRYYDDTKQYSIAFADVKISDGRIIESRASFILMKVLYVE